MCRAFYTLRKSLLALLQVSSLLGSQFQDLVSNLFVANTLAETVSSRRLMFRIGFPCRIDVSQHSSEVQLKLHGRKVVWYEAEELCSFSQLSFHDIRIVLLSLSVSIRTLSDSSDASTLPLSCRARVYSAGFA